MALIDEGDEFAYDPYDGKALLNHVFVLYLDNWAATISLINWTI
jgi:hypothetical protein